MLSDRNLNQYKIFYAVAEAGNISRAAEELFISQPAISKAISRLEASMDTTLFIRNHRGVALTEEGEVLYRHLSEAFEMIKSAEDRIKHISELEIGHIRIGASATLCKYVLLPYLKGFVKEYPHIKITIECQASAENMKSLEAGKLDFALIAKPDVLKNVDFFNTTEIEDIFVAAPSYLENLNLREGGSSDVSELFAKANLMLLDEENITRKYVDAYLKKTGLEIVNSPLEVNNMDLLIEFAKIGLGVACVIKEFVREDLNSGKIVQIPLSIPIEKRAVGLSYINNAPLTASMQKFIDFYKNAGIS